MHSSEKSVISLLPDPGVLVVSKRRSETLSDLLLRTRKEKNIPAETKITYAGRLDPMAEGLVILLVGESRYEKEKYQSLDKKYLFEVLFGVATDTFDALGKIQNVNFKNISEQDIRNVLPQIQQMNFEYPPFSSKPHDGEPMFMHARKNTLPEKLPLQKGKIKELKLLSIEEKDLAKVLDEIISDIEKVNGDFRQSEIIEDWKKLKEKNIVNVTIGTFEASVTSGLYIRSIAEAMDEVLDMPACALSIKRIQIGNIVPID